LGRVSATANYLTLVYFLRIFCHPKFNQKPAESRMAFASVSDLRSFFRARAVSFRLLIFTATAICLWTIPAHAQVLRPNHWSEEYIRFLQVRGELWGLSPFLRPLDIGEVQQHLGDQSHSRFLAGALQRSRLQPGEATVAVFSENTLTNLDYAGTFGNTALTDGGKADPAWLYHGRQRMEIAYRVRPWLVVCNGMVLDNRLDENSRYIGINQEGLAAFTERATLRMQHKGLSALIGREYLRIGPGFDANLLVSGWSRPMDQIALTFANCWLRYDFVAASLDATAWVQEGIPPRQNRYISLHHLQVRPLEKLYIGIGEAVLYSSSAPELNYLNPALAFYGEVTNGPIGGNILGSLHIAAMPARNITLYADLLLDDIQLEKSGPGDLEPDQYGVMTGLRWADPFRLRGADLSCEYTRITNRTYNGQGGPWERWQHRNEPIAHFLGNDFDRWLAVFSWWPLPMWRAACTLDLRRRGEGRIDKAFDTPWMETPLGEEYSEPFPTGVVEKSTRWSFELRCQPRAALLAFGRIGHCSITNLEHQSGRERSEWQGSVGIEFDLVHKFRLE
jgi:hypothetical protein